MEKYEQLEFELTKAFGHSKTCEKMCLDAHGNEIKIGDNVVAILGNAKSNFIEGFVKDILIDNDYCYITVSSYGGKILDRIGNPSFYEIM